MLRAFLFALVALLFAANASPVALPLTGIVKRSESGPEIGGVNFPDPCIIQVGSTWYSFATRTKGSSIHIQIASSPDFNTWTIVKNANGSQRDALPNLPAWVDQTSWNTWAPSIVQLTNGNFVMYFSASAASAPAKHCVGAAVATSILGPYVPTSNTALICPLSQGGAIDPAGYLDGTQRYIVYKIDGNSLGHGGSCGNTVAPIVPTPLMLQPVAADGVTLQGSPVALLQNNGASDQGIIEAPSITKYLNTYFLFFSSGCFVTNSYTVSYATAKSIKGPFTRKGVLFKTGTYGLTAPGGAEVYKDGGHMVFHANYGSGRALYDAKLTYSVDGSTVYA